MRLCSRCHVHGTARYYGASGDQNIAKDRVVRDDSVTVVTACTRSGRTM